MSTTRPYLGDSSVIYFAYFLNSPSSRFYIHLIPDIFLLLLSNLSRICNSSSFHDVVYDLIFSAAIRNFILFSVFLLDNNLYNCSSLIVSINQFSNGEFPFLFFSSIIMKLPFHKYNFLQTFTCIQK